MAELVSIPISYFEFVGFFEKPDFRLWMDRVGAVQAVFEAWEPWGPHVDNIEIIETGKAAEQGISLKIPAKKIAFFFGPVSCKFSQDDGNWKSVEETIRLLDSAVSALIGHSKAKITSIETTSAIHIQPRSLHFVEILRPFLSSDLLSLDEDPIMTMAAVAKWKNRKLTLDGSAVIANGIYLRHERSFVCPVSFEEIANQILLDQVATFKLLGLEEDPK